MTTGILQFLGTGGSMGIPVIGCDCAVCRSPSPRNKRLRPSVLLKLEEKRILIDCGPDFKEQALRIDLHRLDGVIFTHSHNDHIGGVDDLRMLYILDQKPIPCLCSKETADGIFRRFHYMFDEENIHKKLLGRVEMQYLEGEHGQTVFQGIPIRYISYQQAGMFVNGFRFGDLAYVSDIRHYSEAIFEPLRGIHTLILSALRYEPSNMHFNIDEAVEFSKKVGAQQTYFMHVAHELDHDDANAYLPKNIRMAYDGQQIQFHL